MFQLRDAGEVALWLRAAAQTAVISHRGRGAVTADGNTLTWGCARGKRASSWALVVYNKGAEVAKHPLPGPMMSDAEVLDWVTRCIRFELRLTGPELKRLNTRYVRDWFPGTARALWTAKTGRLFFQDTAMDVQEMIGVKPRIRDAYFSWLKGFDPEAGRPRSTFMRLRAEVRRAYNVDIAVSPPERGLENVDIMPCKRVLTLVPVTRPAWADRVEARLAA
jgi:II/X family phage/plasmid replication protein